MSYVSVHSRPRFSPLNRLLAVGLALLFFVSPLSTLHPTAFAAERAAITAEPTFVYETIYNGAWLDSGRDVAVDAEGNAYVIAYAYNNNNDVLVVKLAPDGSVLWTTPINGSALDIGTGIDVDGAGGVYITGWTDSADFPTLNPLQGALNGPRDAFVAKLSAQDGSFIFSTYLGGGYAEGANDIAVNNAGEIYLVGHTASGDFPTVNPIQGQLNTTYCFCDDAFVSKISADGSTLLYSTYLGGGFDDAGQTIDLDGSGNIYIAGDTKSDDFPTVNPIQASNAGGLRDVFVARISADGSALDYSTYLGGEEFDRVGRIAVDGAGNAYVAGTTRSVGFPTTPGAFQEQFVGGILECGSPPYDPLRNCDDIFLSKIAPDGSALAYSTFLGGSEDDQAHSVAVDSSGQAHLVGNSASLDFPPLGSVSAPNIIVSQLDASGSYLNYTIGIDSASYNQGHGIAIDGADDIYITGAKNAPADIYVAKLGAGSPPPNDTVHVENIELRPLSRTSFADSHAVRAVIEVRDQSGAPVEGADVSVIMTTPDGSSKSPTRTTNEAGRVVFRAKSKVGGLWEVCVTDIVKAGLTYAPLQNVETCDSIVYP